MRFPSNGCCEGFCWACWHGAPSAEWCKLQAPCPHEVSQLKRYEWMGIKRPETPSASGNGQGAPIEGMLGKKYPLVLEMLSATTYEDGGPRQTSTLLLFVEGGTVKGCLNDRDIGRTAWAASTTLEGLLASFESRLEKDGLEWRPGGGKRPQGRK